MSKNSRMSRISLFVGIIIAMILCICTGSKSKVGTIACVIVIIVEILSIIKEIIDFNKEK